MIGTIFIIWRKLAQLEKDLASVNGTVQATKSSFEEERLKYIKQLEEEKEKAQADRLKYEAGIDQLQHEVAAKGANTSASASVIRNMMPEDQEEHSSNYYLTVILNDLKEKRTEGESRAVKV